jgi:low temperature requirement protein LtrA
MKLAHIISRQPSVDTIYTLRKHTPWIASPLERLDTDSLPGTPPEDGNKQPRAHHGLLHPNHRAEQPHWKHHHESSTIELFYDLFFVANLATFTANHEIVDAHSLKNYLGFFTILWFTWLETSLFDVRFATDSVFNRVCKAISFGVMTGFAITGAIYDTSDVAENVKAFRALSIILMVSRIALVVQYGVVLYYVREYKQTFLPLASTMLTLFIAAMVYLGTFWGYDIADTGDSFPIQRGNGLHTYISYYVVACVEALSTIIISCVWRVVSFKHTHLVERIGLLTLIIMGEGIIGMSKSVSKIIQNGSSTSSSDIGVIISAVLLIYFIWVLYFDQIENDRFGTIRQQIWAILHYPLHVAILLTVEGSTALILWNIINTVDNQWYNLMDQFVSSDPNDQNYDFTTWNNTDEVIEYMHQSLEQIGTYFKNGTIEKFNSSTVFHTMAHLNGTFNSESWIDGANDAVNELWYGVENFIFENFGIEVDEGSASAEATADGTSIQDEVDQNNKLYTVFDTVFTYFPIAAGVFLVLLAVLFWMGKQNKSRGEWASVVVRLVAGVGLSMMALAVWYPAKGDDGGFVLGPWPVVTVMLAYLFVIVLDNTLVWYWNRIVVRKMSRGGVLGKEEAGESVDASGAVSLEEPAREVH